MPGRCLSPEQPSQNNSFLCEKSLPPLPYPAAGERRHFTPIQSADNCPRVRTRLKNCVILSAFFCRDRDDRFLACAIGSLLFELFFCLREYMLFSFCVVRLGSREALSLSTSSICLYTVLEELFGAVHACRKHAIPIGN